MTFSSCRAAVGGEAALRLYGATRNAQAYGVNLRWASPVQLRVEYLKARRILQESKTVTIAGTPVQVEAVAGVNDPAAPAGGMEYSQQHGATP